MGACLLVVGLGLLLLGCATTPKINWDARIGQYTFDQAVLDYGPPDKSAKLTDGTQVCEWLTQRGYPRGGIISTMPAHWLHYYELPTPDSFLRLTFDPAGKLTAWKKIRK